MNAPDVDDLNCTLSAIRAVSDMLCNMHLAREMNMVRPENLDCLISILADRMEKALNM